MSTGPGRGQRAARARRASTTSRRSPSASDAELAEWYGASDGDAWRGMLLAEMDRRDREAPKRDPRAELRAGWELMAHAQFLEAERLCRGELLNKRGERECIDPWSLWSGPAHRAELYASEELLEFWREVSRGVPGLD